MRGTQALLEACGGQGRLSSLVHLNYGGEAVRPAAVAAMRIAAPNAELRDAYGPTEASVRSMIHSGHSILVHVSARKAMIAVALMRGSDAWHWLPPCKASRQLMKTVG